VSESLSDRMKSYEKEFYSPELGYVDSCMPAFVRIDGKAFHTWTKGFNKPFDKELSETFQKATISTIEGIGQILMAYSQSDEVTFLLNGWEKENSQIYFNGKVQKIVSVMSSIFTAYFNKFVMGMCFEKHNGLYPHEVYGKSYLAFFDARVFNVPKNEIVNLFIWRQLDAKRNSIQALARSLYSHTEVNGKNQDEMKKMCLDKGMSWDNLSPLQKWGFVVHNEKYEMVVGDGMVERSRWIVDTEIPFFVDDRNYINNLLENKGE
jgi:tRNA(His) 5'-end guanylyltransferase